MNRITIFVLATIITIILVLSGIKPHDRLTWFLEVSWVIVGLPLIVLTYRAFPLTPLLYFLLFLHALILIIGGYYTYELVPVGLWAKEGLGLARNHYDRVGHFFQGFVPAILVREILLRRSPLVPGKWLFFLVVAVCLAFSAFFELLEWGAAMSLGKAADAYLATQGDVWDTQWDMFFALIGSVTAQLVLQSLHNRQLEQLKKTEL